MVLTYKEALEHIAEAKGEAQAGNIWDDEDIYVLTQTYVDTLATTFNKPHAVVNADLDKLDYLTKLAKAKKEAENADT